MAKLDYESKLAARACRGPVALPARHTCDQRSYPGAERQIRRVMALPGDRDLGAGLGIVLDLARLLPRRDEERPFTGENWLSRPIRLLKTRLV